MSGARPDLGAIKARAEAASSGPWNDGGWDVFSDSDHAFICHAREDIPQLVSYAEALEAALRAILQAYATVDLEQQHAAMQAARVLLGEG
jgi:hypothetical protein